MQTVEPIRDKDEIEAMKKYLLRRSYRDWFMFMMGINTGLRISDLLRFRVRDVKEKTHIYVKEKKTKKEKRFIITIPDIVAEYVQGMGDDDYLFTSRYSKKPITRIQAYRILNEAAEKIGIKQRSPVGTHTLRKTFGYHFYKQHKDVALLQNLFNHSSQSVTLRYIGINQDILDEKMSEFRL